MADAMGISFLFRPYRSGLPRPVRGDVSKTALPRQSRGHHVSGMADLLPHGRFLGQASNGNGNPGQEEQPVQGQRLPKPLVPLSLHRHHQQSRQGGGYRRHHQIQGHSRQEGRPPPAPPRDSSAPLPRRTAPLRPAPPPDKTGLPVWRPNPPGTGLAGCAARAPSGPDNTRPPAVSRWSSAGAGDGLAPGQGLARHK